MKVNRYLTPEGLIEIEDMAAKCYTSTMTASKIGVNRETLRRWTNAHPEIAEAIERGRKRLTHDILCSLVKLALGTAESATTKIEERLNDEGELEVISVTTTTNQPVPDRKAIIALLSNIDKYHPVQNPDGFLENPAERFAKELALCLKTGFYSEKDYLESTQRMFDLQQDGLPKAKGDSAQEDVDERKE